MAPPRHDGSVGDEADETSPLVVVINSNEDHLLQNNTNDNNGRTSFASPATNADSINNNNKAGVGAGRRTRGVLVSLFCAVCVVVVVGLPLRFYHDSWWKDVSSVDDDDCWDDEHDTNIILSTPKEIRNALENLDQNMIGTIYLAPPPSSGGGEVHGSRSGSGISNSTPLQFSDVANVWRQDCSSWPAAVVEAFNEDDVRIAIVVLAELKSKFDVPFRIRSGGHSKGCYSAVHGGIILSLAQMNDVRLLSSSSSSSVIDGRVVETATALIQPGANVMDVLDTLMAITPLNGEDVSGVLDSIYAGDDYDGSIGYAGVVGMCSLVGEGGFVLGGGIGYLSRLLGLGVDHVLQMRIVLADGSVMVTSKGSHPDLFWALRGAGHGNFGIVTEIMYRVYAAPIQQLSGYAKISTDTNPWDGQAEFFYKLGEINPPGELVIIWGEPNGLYLSWFGLATSTTTTTTTTATNATNSNGGALLNSTSSNENILLAAGDDHNYDNDDDDDVVRAGTRYIRDVLSPMMNQNHEGSTFDLTEVSWPKMTRAMATGGYIRSVWAVQCWTGFLYPENNTIAIWTDIISTIRTGMIESPNLEPDVELWGGAISSMASSNDTSFPYREAIYNVGVLLVIPSVNISYDSEQGKQHQRWENDKTFKDQINNVNAWWPRVAQYLTGVYVNYPMRSLHKNEYPRAYWGDNLETLINVKQKYDPNNTFSFEQSIPMKL